MSGRLFRRVAFWLAKLPLYAGRCRPSFPDLFIVSTWVGLADFSGYGGESGEDCGRCGASESGSGQSFVCSSLPRRPRLRPTNDTTSANISPRRLSLIVVLSCCSLVLVVHAAAILEVEHPPAVVPFQRYFP